MNRYWSYFKEFHSEYLKWNQYACLLLFVGILITLNYYFDIEDSYIDAIKPAILRFPAFLALHGLAYFGVLAILKKFRTSDSSLDINHWLYPLFGIVVLSFDRSIFPHIGNAIVQFAPQPTVVFWFKTLNNLYGWITIFLVLWVWYKAKDKSPSSFYGLQKEGIGVRFYALTGIVVIAITYIATSSSDITSFYPVYQRAGGSMFAHFYGISETISVLIFEFFYLTDFLNTELLFRGYLIVGAAQFLGRNAILPMAATYAVLHFGKPMGETISSFFGGYILGVMALYTRNIWGGVFIHVLLALGMEVFAYWANQ